MLALLDFSIEFDTVDHLSLYAAVIQTLDLLLLSTQKISLI